MDWKAHLTSTERQTDRFPDGRVKPGTVNVQKGTFHSVSGSQFPRLGGMRRPAPNGMHGTAQDDFETIAA